MASRDPITLTLGGVDYRIRPLTLGQVESLDGILADATLAAKPFQQSKAVLQVALARDHADVVFADTEGTAKELADTTMPILVHGGFMPGEAPAAAPSASTGQASAPV